MTPDNIHVPSQCNRVTPILSRIGDKWAVLIVILLANGSLRFSELRKRISNISQRMLTFTLRNLERDGLVKRTVTPSVPPRVDYELTSLGQSLLKVLHELGNWASQNADHIESAQKHYDKLNPTE
ncbi:MAG: transcriptional regulator [Pseudomonas fluorescens]|nr:MAG: transcriptional regulator [Pseudomonas fluorescens]